MDAVAVNISAGLILLDTDETIVIDTMIDDEGDETRNGSQATAAVAPLPDGRWLAVDLTQFKTEATQ